MELFNVQGELKKITNEPCIVALGFFDGVHLAHRRLLQHAGKLAKQHNATLAVMTFFPHPQDILCFKTEKRAYITPLSIKKKIFEQLNIDVLYIVNFDQSFANLSPKQFVKEYILPLNPLVLVAGYDFTYGKNAQGNMRSLVYDIEEKVKVVSIDKLEKQGQKISSTIIRSFIQSGKMEFIPAYLGDYYKIYGTLLPLKSDFYGLQLLVTDNFLFPPCASYQITLNLAGQNYVFCKIKFLVFAKYFCSYPTGNFFIHHNSLGHASFGNFALQILASNYDERVYQSWLQSSVHHKKY